MQTTLNQILEERKHLEHTGVTFIEGTHGDVFLSYGELYRFSRKVLSFLQVKGVRPGDELIFQLDDNKTFVIVFWACILGGMIPVPLTIGQNSSHRQKLFNVWPVLKNPFLIISSDNLGKLRIFAEQTQQHDLFYKVSGKILPVQDALNHEGEGKIFHAGADDISFIQFSSGSTGAPKGVALTHKNLITNMEAISKAAVYTAADSMISWMPLTHDMGLIGFHLNPLFSGMNQYLIPSGLFVRRPSLWLYKATEYRVSILCSPNFGYSYVIKHCQPFERHHWELSSVRVLYNGAEPVSDKLCHEFIESLSAYGLRKTAMCPVYGLAEASLAVSISGIDDPVISVHAARNQLRIGNKIALKAAGDDLVSFVNVGKPVDHCELRIADDVDKPLPDEHVGNVQIKGDNVMGKYYNHEAGTRSVHTADGWLKTGDLGFTRKGSLYITGRSKDIIFVHGQNYYPHDLERVAEEIDGIELNKIAIAGLFNNETNHDEIIAFVFYRGDMKSFVILQNSLRRHINVKAGLLLDRIIPVKDIPRTTSGKLQRFRLLEQYMDGDFADAETQLKQLLGSMEVPAVPVDLPGNVIGQKLLKIYRSILKNDGIDADQKFFEAGGNSLKAAELVMLVRKEFGVELPYEVLYRKQTVRQLAAEIDTCESVKYVSIPVTELREWYKASSSQRRLYYAWESNKTQDASNVPVAFHICGHIDAGKLEHCIRQLIARHDSLRMCFQLEPEPVFKVLPDIAFSLVRITCDRSAIDKTLKGLVRSFDLAQAPLFRISLLSASHDEHILFADFHHIIADGVSIYNFITSLFDLYAGKALPEMHIQYQDYVSWEAGMLREDELSAQEGYWLKHLHGELPLLNLPTDYPRPLIFNTAGAKMQFVLDPQTTARLKMLAQAHKTTLHVVLFTAYNLLLSKYTGQEDVVTGVPVAGRRHPDAYDLIGMFVNNLALRNSIPGTWSFARLLREAKISMEGALAHQDLPFENLMQAIKGKRDVSRNPVFDTMFVYQNMGKIEIQNADFAVSRYFFDPGLSKFDISMEVFDEHESLCYAIEYATALFNAETIVQLASHFDRLVQEILVNPDIPVSKLSLICVDEYDKYIRVFNNTEKQYQKGTSIHALFAEQAGHTPERIAIEHDGLSLTYAQLNNQANHLAMLLRKRGMKQNSCAAILLSRSPELIISILGILKAGGCYVPLDADLPEERIRYILADSRCGTVITNNFFTSMVLSEYEGDPLLLVNSDEDEPYVRALPPVKDINIPGNLAYVIYTSGTTGCPKGVMIDHPALVNYISWAAEQYVGDGTCAFPLYTSISFDLTITSIFTPLITGNRIIIYQEDNKDLLVHKVVADRKADIVKLTPSHLRILASAASLDMGTIKKIIVGGEQLETQLAEKITEICKGDVVIYNEYGPTEATVGCMIHKFEQGDPSPAVPIGVPASNTRIYLLDRFLKPVPAGVQGELYISGAGLAKGYLFKEELTREKFIPDPFVPGQKMYRTGDVARRLHNDIIIFVGRNDQQVKINGYRIELAEIENHLAGYPGVMESAVIVKTEAGGKKLLYGYYRSDYMIGEPELRNYLADRLPYYMVPVRFVWLERMPLTGNGKTDHNALSAMPLIDGIKEPLQPENKLEAISLQIWKTILGDDKLDVAGNFFESGGDSIKAVQIASRLSDKRIFVKPSDILTYQTVRQVCLHSKAGDAEKRYEQRMIRGNKELSSVESWFFGLGLENLNYYNQSVLLELNEPISITLLQTIFQKLVMHHDGLRLNYDAQGKMLFYNDRHAGQDFTIGKFEVGTGADSESMVQYICTRIKNGFDIANGLLLKAAVIHRHKAPDLLFITAHHLVMDGVSWRILLEDLHTLWKLASEGKTLALPGKTASLTDWQRRSAGYIEGEDEKRYWELADDPAFALPTDYETEDWTAGNLATVTGTLDAESTYYLLREAHRIYRTDVPILLNTALVLALKKWTGLNSFVVEQEGHGRYFNDVDASRTVGWFTVFYPIKFELKDVDTGCQIKSIKEQMRCIPGQGVGYGSRYRRGLKRKQTEIRFNYLGQFDSELNNALFRYSHLVHGPETDPRNLMTARLELNVMIINRKLKLEIHYNKKVYAVATTEMFRDAFFECIRNILIHIRNAQELSFTPSDFVVDLNQEELDALFQ